MEKKEVKKVQEMRCHQCIFIQVSHHTISKPLESVKQKNSALRRYLPSFYLFHFFAQFRFIRSASFWFVA
ncbi:hypothetical protein DN36_3206 [Vibrio cholerae]|nr:hypothetical protein DN36_3206 [Vibrio cholerae]